jgi:hypothetical protein
MERLKYSAFAFFFCGSLFGTLAARSMGSVEVASVSAVGILVAAWKLMRLNDHERLAR